jgi:hypothetical protein
VFGHLTVTTPVIAAILFVPFVGLRTLGRSFFVYYALAGVTLGWQWYSIALPSWERWLVGHGAQEKEVAHVARRAGLVWPMEDTIGPFAFHTTAAAVCGVHLGPWLFYHWFLWIMPLSGAWIRTRTGDDYLKNLELITILPAFVAGYVLFLYLWRLATYAWILPTVVLVYEMATLIVPYTSILTPHRWTRFSYFFVIHRTMPTFTPPDYGGIDLFRVVAQMTVVVPFYSGLAYSLGALAARHNLLERFFGHAASSPQAGLEGAQSEKTAEGDFEGEEEAVNEPN